MSLSTYFLFVFFTFLVAVLFAIGFVNPVVQNVYKEKMQTDISVSEMLLLEDKISKFLNDNNLESGVSIEEIAKVLNVEDAGGVDHINTRAKIFDSGCNKKTVVHNNLIPPSEWRFDLAHELGHQINGDPMPANRPIGYNKPQIDQLADYTAAALLMPLAQVNEYLSLHKYESASPRKRVQIVKKLSKKYRVSTTLAVRRVNEVRMLNQI